MIPYIQEQRTKLGYNGCANLIMDGCRCHLTDDILCTLYDASIEIHLLPAHTSHLFQRLDLGIFGIHKLEQKRIRPSEHFSVQSVQIMKILGSFRRVMAPPNVLSAFSQAGIITRWNEEHICLLSYVDIERVRTLDEDARGICFTKCKNKN